MPHRIAILKKEKSFKEAASWLVRAFASVGLAVYLPSIGKIEGLLCVWGDAEFFKDSSW